MSSFGLPMVVDYFDVFRSLVGPFEADSILLIDANTMLPFSIRFQSFELIAGRYPQILERMGLIELIQLAPGNGPKLDWTAFSCGGRVGAVENISGALAREGANHVEIITYNAMRGNRSQDSSPPRVIP